MNRVEGLLDGVDYHQFYLWADDPLVAVSYPPGGPANRLLATTETGHAVCISTGIAIGVVHLTIEMLDSTPPEVDHSCEWEAVAEVNMTAAVPTAMIMLLMQQAKPPFDLLELPSRAAMYRVRGHAAGRSLDYDAVVDGVNQVPRENHLLQMWPVDRLEEPIVVRADDPWSRQGPPYKTPVDVPPLAEQEAARQLARNELRRKIATDAPRTDIAGGTPTRAPSPRRRPTGEIGTSSSR